ncbi:leucine-rich repeat receptor-like tyrosine-protein kinase [Hibiscus syriacus]|uniref:Leucine-rich repeat receptor-like tyrosine-protein kinase n=1 Tax=Hibiscus syriacus TaxID=106335 RepID=A0A6A2YVN5_HIBSY|nr:leucine-rich repeat receptor-like tyrosine-protein kinase [Hibiscus syriacus]
MAQYRQQYQYSNGTAPDHVAIGVRGGGAGNKAARWRRSGRAHRSRRIYFGSLVVVLFLVLVVTVLVYYYISADNNDNRKGLNSYQLEEFDSDFLKNVTRMENFKILNFGNGSVSHGRDSRYWDRDDRRRDDDYNEDAVENNITYSRYVHLDGGHVLTKVKNENGASLDSDGNLDHRVAGLYNEVGRNELKMYEAEYEASLKGGGKSKKELGNSHQLSDGKDLGMSDEVDADDNYDDGIDSSDTQKDEYDDFARDKDYILDEAKSHDENVNESSTSLNAKTRKEHIVKEVKEESTFSREASQDVDVNAGSHHAGSFSPKSGKSSKAVSKKKPRRRKFSGSCDMKLINSTHLVEPVESRKFARFSLQYTQMEKPKGEQWKPKFVGHQSLQEREESFLARDKKINCGFVKGPQGYPSTGFDLAEDDVNYISRCHIAVISCIFGNSDRLRTPAGKMVWG